MMITNREEIEFLIDEFHSNNLAIDIYDLCNKIGIKVFQADEVDMYDKVILGELHRTRAYPYRCEIILKENRVSHLQKRYITAFLLSHYILHILNNDVYTKVFQYYQFMRLYLTSRQIKYMNQAHDYALRTILLPRNKLRRYLDINLIRKDYFERHFMDREYNEDEQFDSVQNAIESCADLFQVEEKVLMYRLGMIT